METPADRAAEAEKVLARPVLKAQVGALCIVVLLVGAWLAPAGDPDPLSAPPPERAAPLLEERASGRSLDVLTEAIAGATNAAQAFAVRVMAPSTRPPRTGDIDVSGHAAPAGSGVVVGDGRVLTHVDALPATIGIDVASGSGRATASVVAFDPASGLVLLAAPVAQGAPPFAPDLTAPSSLIVGVSRTAHGVAGVPAFVTAVDRERVALGAGAALVPGLPLFDPQGRLVALVGSRGAGEAFAVPAALARLGAPVAGATAPVSFGIVLQDRQGALADAFGPAGVIVADVIDGAPAAGELAPGTLVLEVDGVAVETAAAAVTALRAAANRRTQATLTVRRRGDRASRRVAVAPGPAIELWRRARAGVPTEGLGAGAVFAAEALTRAGVDPSARLIAIDDSPVRTDADVRRALRRRPPLVVAVLRDARGRFVAALEPPR